jgi:hypothetical protein
MKQLILTFFAVVLCYSLFFDRKERLPHIDEINYTIQTEAYDSFICNMPDSVFLASLKEYSFKMQ